MDTGVLRFSLEVMGSESGNLIQGQHSRREDRLRIGEETGGQSQTEASVW